MAGQPPALAPPVAPASVPGLAQVPPIALQPRLQLDAGSQDREGKTQRLELVRRRRPGTPERPLAFPLPHPGSSRSKSAPPLTAILELIANRAWPPAGPCYSARWRAGPSRLGARDSDRCLAGRKSSWVTKDTDTKFELLKAPPNVKHLAGTRAHVCPASCSLPAGNTPQRCGLGRERSAADGESTVPGSSQNLPTLCTADEATGCASSRSLASTRIPRRPLYYALLPLS